MRHEALALMEQGVRIRYGFDAIIGIDEAGRGALAGPVYAGACAVTDASGTGFINDSKVLSRRQREQAFELLPAHALVATGCASAAQIDACGILQATYEAMEMAFRLLLPQVQERWGSTARIGVVVDGSLLPPFLQTQPVAALAVVDADALLLSVAAASIAAKVTRDRTMVDLSRRVHGYGFEGNVGYGTQEHIDAIRKRGLSAEHRHSFVIRELVTTEELPFAPRPQQGTRHHG
ncbi:MAG: ribonuclease HII [Candidatus Cryosericum sp.]|nr:ribonuclease HII [Candidatus Cryosericum sp.]HPS69251.1 ribonuclease HII [Candidatus Cryosericum sp.]